MDAAKELFDTLVNFKNADAPNESAHKLFLDYCTKTLGPVERFHFDFKRKTDMRTTELSDDDKKNLAKAISGFANSGGGVLIWGIEDQRIIPKPIPNVQKFVGSMLKLAANITDPVVHGIDGNWVLREGDDGFGLIFVPESLLPPHRVILSHADIKNHYYVRTGESFVVATHTQLEDMFGRRPHPLLRLSKKIVRSSSTGNKINLLVILGIENFGRGVAKAPFLSVQVKEPYSISKLGIDGNGRTGLRELTIPIRSTKKKYGASADTVIHPGIPWEVTSVEVNVDTSENALPMSDLVIAYTLVAEGIKTISGEEVIKGIELQAEAKRYT